MTESDTPPPPQVWRVLGLAVVLLLLTAMSAIGLISAGVFDPRPAGPEQQRRSLQPQQLAAGERRDQWQEDVHLTPPATLRLTAALQEGETDTAYGLSLGAPQRSFTVAVSPTGYAAIWQTVGDDQVEMLLPWQPWPHVAQGREPNEIQVDVQQELVTVRVNRELLWQGAADVEGGLALHAESFGQAATVDFRELVLFYQ